MAAPHRLAHLEAGPHRLRFEAGGMPAGLYFFRLTAGDLAITRRIVLVR